MSPWLSTYPDQQASKLLLDGFSYGFKIPYTGSRTPRFSNNHKSAKLRPDIVSQKLQKEVALGRVAGPFSSPPFDGHVIVSPIGLAPKKSASDFRLIFDLSYPRQSSINEGIDPDLCRVQYSSFDEAVRMVQSMGNGAHLIKVDIQSAFRLLPIHPDDFALLGMYHEGQYFIDKALPFGCSISCALFEKFSTFLDWCLRRSTGSNNLIHYLDDFLAGDRKQHRAQDMLDQILALFERFGVPTAPDKVEGPSTTITYLGIEIDTNRMMLRLPAEKLQDLLSDINFFISQFRQKVTLRQLQSLLGKLNFACRAIQPGRAFCRRLINATVGLSKPHHHKRISRHMLGDLITWRTFLESHNGTLMILPRQWDDNRSIHLFTDASGSIGFGIYFNGRWVANEWPRDMSVSRKHITFLELFPIVLAIHLWGGILHNKKISFHCDNDAVVSIISKQSSRDEPCMALVRILVLACLQHNIVLRAVHIQGKKNQIADALSRLQIAKFRRLCPHAEHVMTPIPQSIWDLLRMRWPASFKRHSTHQRGQLIHKP